MQDTHGQKIDIQGIDCRQWIDLTMPVAPVDVFDDGILWSKGDGLVLETSTRRYVLATK